MKKYVEAAQNMNTVLVSKNDKVTNKLEPLGLYLQRRIVID
jgi:hypothetical protein